MYSFFILGQIPGTSISISFEGWIIIMAIFSYIAYRYWSHIRFILNKLDSYAYGRKTLHASQLHRRAL